MGWLVDGHDVVRLALPAPGRFSAAGGAGRLRRGPGAPELEGVPAAARPGESSRENRRGDLFLSAVAEVDEAEQVELRDGVQRAGNPRRGHPDTCLVPRQQDRHGRPLGWDRERKQGLGDSVVHRPGLTGNSLQLELTAAMHASSPRGDLGLRTQLTPWLQSTHETNALRHVFSRGRVPRRRRSDGVHACPPAAAVSTDDDGSTTRRRRLDDATTAAARWRARRWARRRHGGGQWARRRRRLDDATTTAGRRGGDDDQGEQQAGAGQVHDRCTIGARSVRDHRTRDNNRRRRGDGDGSTTRRRRRDDDGSTTAARLEDAALG